jgi:hypothetical protein
MPTKNSKSNEILRKAYERRTSTSKSMNNSIEGGRKGTLPKISNNMELTKYGYTLRKSAESRKKSLRSASKANKTLPVLRRLNLIRNYSKWHASNYKKLSADVEYMKNYYQMEKSRNSKRSGSRKATKK